MLPETNSPNLMRREASWKDINDLKRKSRGKIGSRTQWDFIQVVFEGDIKDICFETWLCTEVLALTKKPLNTSRNFEPPY